MSASKYSFIQSKCLGDFCPVDCDGCPKEFLCPPGCNVVGACEPDQEICVECWEKYGKEKHRELERNR